MNRSASVFIFSVMIGACIALAVMSHQFSAIMQSNEPNGPSVVRSENSEFRAMGKDAKLNMQAQQNAAPRLASGSGYQWEGSASPDKAITPGEYLRIDGDGELTLTVRSQNDVGMSLAGSNVTITRTAHTLTIAAADAANPTYISADGANVIVQTFRDACDNIAGPQPYPPSGSFIKGRGCAYQAEQLAAK